MPPVVSFLEDQTTAITTWRDQSAHTPRPMTLVGVGNRLHLMNADLQIMDSVSLGTTSRVSRLIGVAGHSSVFFSSADGAMGFVATGHSKLGKVEQSASPTALEGDTAVDSDIHRSGHLATILFNDKTGGSLALVDTQRDSVMGRIPLGQTGTPNGVRIVDNSLIAVGSSIVSIFDVRTSQSKSGIASKVLAAPSETAGGRVFTSIESDGTNTVIAGDSAGGLWLWDCRQPAAPANSTHAHSGAVLALSLGGGIVGSSATDGSVSLWTISADQTLHPRKKSRKILLEESGHLKRSAVQGSGAATALCVEAATPGPERLVAYATDTGVVALASVADWGV